MCVRVRFASQVTTPWDPANRVITVPAGLIPELALHAVRAVLTKLVTEQPDDGAVCWCGETVKIDRIPTQRTEVSHSGT